MRDDIAPRTHSTHGGRYMQHNSDSHPNRKRPLHHSSPLERDDSYRIPPPRNSRPDYRSSSNLASQHQGRSFGQNRSHSSGRPRVQNERFHGSGYREPSKSNDRYRNDHHNYRRNSMPESQRGLPRHRTLLDKSNQSKSFRPQSKPTQRDQNFSERFQKSEISGEMNNKFIKGQTRQDSTELTHTIERHVSKKFTDHGKEQKRDPETAKKSLSFKKAETNFINITESQVKSSGCVPQDDLRPQSGKVDKSASLVEGQTESSADLQHKLNEDKTKGKSYSETSIISSRAELSLPSATNIQANGELRENKESQQEKPMIQNFKKRISMDKKDSVKSKNQVTTADKINGWFKSAPKKSIKKGKLQADSKELKGIPKKASSISSEGRIAKTQKLLHNEIDGEKVGIEKASKSTMYKTDYSQSKNKISAYVQKGIGEEMAMVKKQVNPSRSKSVADGKKLVPEKISKGSQHDERRRRKKTKNEVNKKSKNESRCFQEYNEDYLSGDQVTKGERHDSGVFIETSKVLEDRKLSPHIVSDDTASALEATESSFESTMLQGKSDLKEAIEVSRKKYSAPTRELIQVPEQKECNQSDSDTSSDSDTDEEELLLWGEKMFGVTPPALLKKRLGLIESSEESSDNEEESDEDEFDETYSRPGPAAQFRWNPPTKRKTKKRKTKKRKVEVETEEERKRKKEEAKPLTAEQIRAILKDDDVAMPSSHWVRRSSRQPSKDALKTIGVRNLRHNLTTNHPDMVVLKMKKYINDPDTPQVVIDGALDALEENTNCQALYIQNFNKGMQDEQVLHLLRILQLPTCKIWCLNIGETYNVKSRTWKRFARGLKRTKITHMYASEHTIESELKDKIRITIRNNREKHDMHKNPNNLDVIIQCTHCWWNPINTKSLRPFIRKKGYEHLLFDKEGQGLRGSTSGAPGSGAKKNPQAETM